MTALDLGRYLAFNMGAFYSNYSRRFLQLLMLVLMLASSGFMVPQTGRAEEEEGEMQTLVDEVRVKALKMARPRLQNEDYELHEDSWDNLIDGGTTQYLKVQLFKGSQYCFWFSVHLPTLGKGTASFAVLDGAGNVVPAKTRQENGVWEAYLVAPKTGAYRVRMTIAPGPGAVPVALLYGFR